MTLQDREALAAFDAALAREPGNAALWNNRGLVLDRLGRAEEALASFTRAAGLAPGSIEPHNNRGDTLRQLRRPEEALASFARALAIDPADAAALNNRAVTLAEMGRVDEALGDYGKAMARHPNLPEALLARGNLLWSHKAMLAPALADLTQLMTVAPNFPYAAGSLMRLKMTAADWRDFPAGKALLDQGVRAGLPVVEPFIYLSLSDQPADLRRCAELYIQHRFPARPPLPRPAMRREGRVRIGYVCGEFRTHATLYLMAGLFEAHDRGAFEIFAFDNGSSDDSPLRARFERAVEHIIPIAGLSDAQAAARIAAEEIDILVDLNTHSGKPRLGMFACRPAPVQVTYLAYPGTSGAPYMDYILADKIVIPESQQHFYCEKIAWLPGSYQINDSQRVIAQTPSRAEAGLPATGFVFCNFNHASKFTPDTFSRWMRLLAQVPGSVLWLLAPDPLAEENLKREALLRNVAPERLIFAPALPFDRHLARLRLADLFLDGLPYGAHTTASDALWAGLPVITLLGRAFAGRVAASLLNAAGLPELVTQSAEEFENLALSLARGPEKLAAIRARVAAARTTPLFDTQAKTRAIERAWRIMLEKNTPESFSVPD